ncbi:MAG: hypothetical protein GY797_32425 [Deltaproteobacteria bacterium]|nr:hypothetical protein [Deltaproteobacteria bacterium]
MFQNKNQNDFFKTDIKKRFPDIISDHGFLFPEVDDRCPKSHIDWIPSIIERLIFTFIVAISAKTALIPMGGWIALKLASGWQRRNIDKSPFDGPPESTTDTAEDLKIGLIIRLFSMNAVIGSIISLFFAFVGGISLGFGLRLIKNENLEFLKYLLNLFSSQ